MSEMSKELNLPNKLTILRIFAIPVFLVILYYDKSYFNVIACILYTIAALTDYVDGYIARKYNLVTDLGKILDPVADKILVAATMIALVEMGRLEGAVVMLILARDFAMGALRNVASSKGVIIAAGKMGKWKTAFQMVGVGMIIFKNELFGVDIMMIGKILVYISLVLSVYSAVQYFNSYYGKEDEQSTD
ncbi:CDP-diacylglycerol--glycerol-3-phosphate 3-phosphatidyltransferase [Limisalsivibrio acetivorans]|uniref:CDP-diacylglycerol--glycerol-3-phosphate 3-phosphatidyltransferase n=1 Tax=Limisalsivibrio acetivorans TaxID=1304888 RepID=UPI0003B50E69|nr:CDP-diacylglycerol--glycerol-3-phosphate 3-phosphatidyltransferase [Limisalsivibrio acetivorans]